jgi:hypothetical protein
MEDADGAAAQAVALPTVDRLRRAADDDDAFVDAVADVVVAAVVVMGTAAANSTADCNAPRNVSFSSHSSRILHMIRSDKDMAAPAAQSAPANTEVSSLFT